MLFVVGVVAWSTKYSRCFLLASASRYAELQCRVGNCMVMASGDTAVTAGNCSYDQLKLNFVSLALDEHFFN